MTHIETYMAIIVWVILVVLISVILYWIANGIEYIYKLYRKPDDCPFMFGYYVNYFKSEMFLRWVWHNKKHIEPAFKFFNEWSFFITTPYVLGGWMFISFRKCGIDLNIAHDKTSFGNSYSKSSYSPNWPYVSHSSKLLWKKVYSWFEEQNRIANEKYDKNWINPLILNNNE